MESPGTNPDQHVTPSLARGLCVEIATALLLRHGLSNGQAAPVDAALATWLV